MLTKIVESFSGKRNSKKSFLTMPKSGVVATKHGKEKVIIPAIETVFPKLEWLSSTFDTDTLGTFSGEVERKKNALETALEKAKKAAELTGAEVAISSEGSFGPHPAVPWVPSGTEIILVYDARNRTFWYETEITLETNFASAEVKTEDEVLAFIKKVQFPSHAVIVRSINDSAKHDFRSLVSQRYGVVHKGITDYDELMWSFQQCKSRSDNGSVRIETDMRAHMNPTRMNAIAKLSSKVASRFSSTCPECSSFGYGKVSVQSGLPCSGCGFPTKMTQYEVWSCAACGCSEKKKRSDGLLEAPASDCDLCNP